MLIHVLQWFVTKQHLCVGDRFPHHLRLQRHSGECSYSTLVHSIRDSMQEYRDCPPEHLSRPK